MTAPQSNVHRLRVAEDDSLHCIEAEQALLGAMLVHPFAFERAATIVTADDFSEGQHRALFLAFEEANRAGRKLDVRLACDALGENARTMVTDSLTVAEYVARLAAEATSITFVSDYAKTVQGYADRRRLALAADYIGAAVRKSDSAAEVAGVGIDMLDEITARQASINTPTVSLHDAAQQALHVMTEGMQNPGRLNGATWGLADLDNRTSGIARGELVILGGRPSMGKTALALTCARLSAAAGEPAFYSSLEMTATPLATRALTDIAYDYCAPIEYCRVARGDVSDMEAERLIDAGRTLKALPLTIDPQAALNVGQICARARKHQRRLEQQGKRLSTLWVDHLHLVRASDRYRGQRTNEISEISGALKALAKELDIGVVALAQLSRQVEGRDDKRPYLSDLRDSGSIEQDADCIIFVYRDAYYLERIKCSDPAEDDKRYVRLQQVRNELEAIVAKQRNGPIGTLRLFCDVGANAVRCLAPDGGAA